uniref:Integrase core domain containing protein n=1 Tax=Solanum tuberosum TaxID=4113 RepID=M1DYN1_SOLTU
MLGALFSEDITQPEPTCSRGKRPLPSRITDTTEEARKKKREHQQHEQARKVSIVNEELHQQRVREGNLGASSSRPTTEATVRDDVSTTDGAFRVIDSTTEGVILDDMGTTDGGPSVVPAVFRKPDPPAC